MTKAAAPDEAAAGILPALRQRLLDGMLRHAPFDGWTETALAAAARDAGVAPDLAAIAFQGGLAELAEFFNIEADRRMAEAVEAAIAAATRGPAIPDPSAVLDAVAATGGLPPQARPVGLKIRERVTLAVRTRLEQHGAHREALRALASFLAMPAHAGLASRCLWRTVDAMWRAVGDSATDFSYYTKRTLLAGVYGSTVLVWLDDSSEGFADSFAFLDRRVADVMAIERGKARVRQRLGGLMHRIEVMWGRPTGGARPRAAAPEAQPFPPDSPTTGLRS